MTSQTAAGRVRERARRAGRGWGLERQRAHREKQAPPLSEEEASHVALVEAVASGQREQEASAVADVVSEGAVAKRSPSGVTSAPSEAPVVHPGRGSSSGGRDPRLGPYRNVGSFLEHCWRRLEFSRADVYAVAGLASYEKPESLLLYTGGLPALYSACEAKKKARAA